MPSSQVEDDITSSVATIVEVEFPSVYAEQYVNITAEQLYARCGDDPHLHLGEPGDMVGEPSLKRADLDEIFGESTEVQLDNSGNAFVVVVGSSSVRERQQPDRSEPHQSAVHDIHDRIHGQVA